VIESVAAGDALDIDSGPLHDLGERFVDRVVEAASREVVPLSRASDAFGRIRRAPADGPRGPRDLSIKPVRSCLGRQIEAR